MVLLTAYKTAPKGHFEYTMDYKVNNYLLH